MIDVTGQINAVRRQVGDRVLEAGEGHVVVISQVYDADLDDLWDACTNPERLPRWFAPVAGELRLGGRYQIEGNAGGTIERCDPPKGFAATWEYGGSVSWIEVRLTAEPAGGTRFALEHTLRNDDHWAEFGPGATGVGWDLGFLSLATHLAGQPVEPEEKWAITEEGVRFMTLSAGRWGDADIEGGADADAARAAAGRTAAAYAG